MSTTIESLPSELLALVLKHTAELNANDSANFTYGLSQAPLPIQKSSLERTIRGQKPLDILRWESVDAVRQVSSRWHDWALSYALRELYIRRWRGSERWAESKELANLHGKPLGVAVYREPYNALKTAAKLVSQNGQAGAHIRRLWFDGFHTLETSRSVLRILDKCTSLQSATLPWTSIRYFSAAEWKALLTQSRLTSLELTAIDLKASQISDELNSMDLQPLRDESVNFANIERLKIAGSTNFKPITDDDLLLIARTARHLRALHVTGISDISIHGLMPLVEASRHHLTILEYSPLSEGGFDHLAAEKDSSGKHWCSRVTSCPRLTDLNVSLPTICADIFNDHDVQWTGDVHLRASGICNHSQSLGSSATLTVLTNLLDASRALTSTRHEKGAKLSIELFIDNWLFEPSKHRVHGNIEVAEELARQTWPTSKDVSFKGPYGQTGLYGKEEGPFSSISEEEFFEGLSLHHISLEWRS